MIDRLLANSSEPPVIILQSDHGSGVGLSTESAAETDMHERMSILNAYYLPDRKGDSPLYQSISPVNSFRVVLNTYFDAGLELLPDRSYYSTWSEPFKFIDVTDKVRLPSDTGRRQSCTADVASEEMTISARAPDERGVRHPEITQDVRRRVPARAVSAHAPRAKSRAASRGAAARAAI